MSAIDEIITMPKVDQREVKALEDLGVVVTFAEFAAGAGVP